MSLWSNTTRPTWVPAANGQLHQVFPTTAGWVLRHYKGNNNYWDETLATRQHLLRDSNAANITAVAITANQNYASLTVSSGVGNSFTWVHNTRPFGNVFQMSNSTTFTSNAEIISTSNVVPYTQLAIDTSNLAAFANGTTLYQSNGTANTATGVLFFANTTVLRVRDVTGSWGTANTVQANTTQNAAVSGVSANVTGTLIVRRLAGRFGTSNVIQNGFANLTVSAANNWANGTVSVFFDEPVNVAGGTPSLVVSTADTTNATATFQSSSNNTNRLLFNFTANGDAAATFRVLGQTISLNSATIRDVANNGSANILFANSVVANVKFGVSGANISV